MKTPTRCIREQAKLGTVIREARQLQSSAADPADVLKKREELNAATAALLACRKGYRGKTA